MQAQDWLRKNVPELLDVPEVAWLCRVYGVYGLGSIRVQSLGDKTWFRAGEKPVPSIRRR